MIALALQRQRNPQWEAHLLVHPLASRSQIAEALRAHSDRRISLTTLPPAMARSGETDESDVADAGLAMMKLQSRCDWLVITNTSYYYGSHVVDSVLRYGEGGRGGLTDIRGGLLRMEPGVDMILAPSESFAKHLDKGKNDNVDIYTRRCLSSRCNA